MKAQYFKQYTREQFSSSFGVVLSEAGTPIQTSVFPKMVFSDL